MSRAKQVLAVIKMQFKKVAKFLSWFYAYQTFEPNKLKTKTMTNNYLAEQTNCTKKGFLFSEEPYSKDVEIIGKDDFLDDLYENTFFDKRIIDELEDYLIQNKLTIIKIK
jgi:hypothetical protein